MKRVKVFYLDKCKYCKNLMKELDGLKIPYESVDVNSVKGEKDFLNLYKLTKSDRIPTVIVGNQVLVPEIAFSDISTAIKIITELYNKE